MLLFFIFLFSISKNNNSQKFPKKIEKQNKINNYRTMEYSFTKSDLCQHGLLDEKSKRILLLDSKISATLDHIKITEQLLRVLNSTEFQTNPNEYLDKMQSSSAIRHYIVRAVYDVLEYIVARKMFGVSCNRATQCPCGVYSSVDQCILAILNNDPNVRTNYTSDDVAKAITIIRQCELVKELPWRV